MRVALVHSYYSSAQPSGENVVVDLQAAALTHAGHEVHVVSASTDTASGSPLYPLRAAVRVATGRGNSPREQLERIAPDIVHVHNLFPNFAEAWLDDWRGPLVATLHNYRQVCAAGTLYRDAGPCELCPTRGSWNAVRHSCYRGGSAASIPLALATRGAGSRRPILRRADRLIALSDRAAHTLGRLSPAVDIDRISVLPNFVEPAAPTVDQGSGGWVYVGRLSPEKGIARLVEAWPDDAQLTIVGDGPDNAEVREKARGKRVTLVGGLTRRDALKHTLGARGLVFPSVWAEPAPAMSYLEALAAGVPTLAWPGTAVSDDVEASGSGIVATPAETAAAVRRLEGRRDTYSAAARARFSARYSETSWLASIEAVYAEAAG